MNVSHGTCAICGTVHDRKRKDGRPAGYCLSCHASHMRRTRPKYSQLDAETKTKSNARARANQYQKRGKITPQPCCKCGKAKAEKHHPDYSKPLEVVWLCRKCHLAEHQAAGALE